MSITIVQHTDRWREPVEAFNRRLRLGGAEFGWYVDPRPTWLARESPDQRTWREYWLAVEDGTCVRGAYGLRPQLWEVRGRPVWVTDWQGPVSEGAVSRKYNSLGLRLVRDMLKKRPLLYSWGHGSDTELIVQMLRRMGWLLHPTPFALRVIDGYRFLRLNQHLRESSERRLLLDALAMGGVGPLGVEALHRAIALRHGGARRGSYEIEPEFGEWAGEIWHRARDAYAALSARDMGTLQRVMPREHANDEWGAPTRLRVRGRDGEDIGWVAVSARDMRGDARFGEMRVGTLIDYFARPEDAATVVAAGLDHLRESRVDVVIANQSHPAWLRAFAANGFVLLRNRRFFAVSPALREALEPFDETQRGLFLTNMDGHGPMGL